MFWGLTSGAYKISVPTNPAGFIPTQLNIGSDVTDADDPTGVMVMIPNPIALPTGENGTGDQPGGFNGYPDNQDDLTYDFGYVSVDYGDLPNTYATTIGSNGPKHIVNPNLKLGSSVDGELDGQPEAMAGFMTGGDDGNNGLYNEGGAGDDENGVVFETPMIPGYTACVRVTSMNNLGAPAVLQGWVDWNGNGTFDAGEQLNTGAFTAAAPGAIVPNGTTTNQFCFDVPATATFQGGAAFVRFRLSPTGGLTAGGPAAMPYPVGEVEDYKVPLSKVGNYVWIDANINGLQDENGVLGINNVTVQLQWAGPDGNFATTIDNRLYEDVTGPEGPINGKYVFCGLIPGAYKLVVPPFGYVPTLLIDVNGNTQDVIDSDNPAGVMVMIPNPINLITGENGTGDNPGLINGFPDNQDNLSYDFGYLGFDFGDLPNTYATTQSATGAVHTVNPDLYLGSCVDIDLDGQPDPMAGFMGNGDDGNAGPGVLGTCAVAGDDENGISFPTPLIPGNAACVKVTARNQTNGPAILQAWIDFNGNGTFEANEQLTTGNFAPAGATIPNGGVTAQNFCFDVPVNASFNGGDLLARFRLSKAGGVGPTGPAIPGNGVFPTGEVEDYKLPLALIGSSVWMDNPDIEGDQDASEMLLGNVKLNLIWNGEDGIFQTAANSATPAGDDRVYMVTTDVNGKYLLRGLIPNTTYRVLPEKYTAANGVAGALINPVNKILTIPDLPGNDNLDSDAKPFFEVTVPNLTSVFMPVGENSPFDSNGASGFPDNKENLSLDIGFIDEPKVNAAMAIVGFDPTVCGEFAAWMDICIENTSTTPLASIQAMLDIAGPNAFGAAFKGMIGSPIVISSTAQQDPVFNAGYTGASTAPGKNLFNGTSGLLWPGEKFCFRIKFGVDPDAPGAPAQPKAQAMVSGKAQNFQGVPVPDYWNGGQQYMAMDLSDVGTNPQTTNPGFTGDTGGSDDPTTLGNCWQTTQQMTCNDLVHISVDDESCEALILASMVMEGEINACTEEVYPLGGFYDVTIMNAQGQPIPNPVPLSYMGQTLMYSAKHIMTCNSCWGSFILEDKLAPHVTCEEITLNCAIQNYTPAYLLNTLGIQAANPTVTDCSPFTVNYVDTWHDLACNEGFNGHDDLSAYVTRVWTAVDAYGNASSCTQYIYFERIHVGDVQLPADATVSCDAPSTSPSATGAPFVTAYGKDWLLWPSVVYCETSVTYTDVHVPVCDGTYKIERTWRIHDWCLPTSQTPPFNPLYYIQIITVMDNQGPAITCPSNVTVSTDPFTCCATTNLPDAIITDACSRVDNIQAKVVGFDYYTGDSLGIFVVGGSLTSFPGNNLWNPDTLGAYGYTPCLPRGVHHVYYYATDNCGNESVCSFQLTVDDQTPPVVACDQFTKVSLGLNGESFVDATTFDDGSYDNCSDVHFKVRRMDDNSCDPNNEFDDQVKFCCSDIGDTITVVLRVYDVDVTTGAVSLTYQENHSNDCMVQVFVEDKIKPVCVSPTNVTVSCENFDPSLWAYGNASPVDNCCLDDTKVYQGQIGLTHTVNYSQFDTLCNKGTIVRTFRAFDCFGNSSQCTQRIVVNYEQDYYVKFPNDVIVTECDGTGNYGEPTFFGEDCELLGVSYEDELFTVVPDACFKIERTWTIINWCTYNPNLPCTTVPNPNPNSISNHPSNLPGPIVSAPGTLAPWNPTVVKINPTDAQATNYSTFWTANANCYKYKQIIKVIDTEDPIFDNCPVSPVEVCDVTSNDGLLWNDAAYWDNTIGTHDLCEGPADLCYGNRQLQWSECNNPLPAVPGHEQRRHHGDANFQHEPTGAQYHSILGWHGVRQPSGASEPKVSLQHRLDNQWQCPHSMCTLGQPGAASEPERQCAARGSTTIALRHPQDQVDR
ncbi:MAG: hypothetical protein IPL65_15485 [Lewinellaceae bacterium]|nr:hypothetical protein [Lewinellaceae bacterium]